MTPDSDLSISQKFDMYILIADIGSFAGPVVSWRCHRPRASFLLHNVTFSISKVAISASCHLSGVDTLIEAIDKGHSVKRPLPLLTEP
jgi:hypothetical protein